MKKRTVGIIATMVVVILGGISGLLVALAAGVPELLVSYMPVMSGSTLSIPDSSGAPSLGFLSQMGSCCICIPIPLVFGLFAIHRRAKAGLVEEPLS